MILYLMHGVAGSGKSTLIRNCNLEKYSINPDKLRLKFAGTKIDDFGREVISNEQDKKVWYVVYRELEKRMNRGDPIVILDATNLGSLGKYRFYATKYGYQIVIVDFNVPLEELLRRNTQENRGIALIPEEVTVRMFQRKEKQDLSGYTVITSDEFSSLFM